MVSKILFLGSKQIGLECIKKLHLMAPIEFSSIVTFDDVSDERSKKDEIIKFGIDHKIVVKVITKPSTLGDVIEVVQPDLCIVVGWYWIIPPAMLDKVKYGFIGIHASLLPKYRGFAPLVWSIINSEKETGVTLFYFAEGVDNGDIIDQKRFLIEDNESIRNILEKAESQALQLLEDNIIDVVNCNNKRFPQNHREATYCSKRKPEDGLIEWTKPNVEIINLIRAISPPYPCAFSFLSGEKIYIVEAELFTFEYFGIPGLVARVDEKGALVCCGKGAILITKVRTKAGDEVKPQSLMKFDMKFNNNY